VKRAAHWLQIKPKTQTHRSRAAAQAIPSWPAVKRAREISTPLIGRDPPKFGAITALSEIYNIIHMPGFWSGNQRPLQSLIPPTLGYFLG